ncbi:MAG: hypothetical protein ACLU99_08325 [Alphaproteobacteria bacterium]
MATGELGEICLTVLLMLAATLWFRFNQIVDLSSAAYLISYLAVFSANWIFAPRDQIFADNDCYRYRPDALHLLAFMASLVIEA